MWHYFYTASDAKRVRAFGRGIQPHGLRVQDEAKFKIVTEGAGEGVPEVNVIGPGKNSNQCLIFMLTTNSVIGYSPHNPWVRSAPLLCALSTRK